MKVKYNSRKLQRECINYSITKKVHGENMAEKIHLRIDQLNAANSIEELIQFNVGRCHPLSGDRNGEFAMDLVHPFRLVFKREINVEEIILIISIENYH